MSQRSQATITILAVDNDRDVLATIGRALKRDGHHVIEADDARTALELARMHRPDVIILDIMLSDMDGFELCAHLRNLPYTDHTPILFLSVHQGAQYVARALECGGDDYLRKPFAMPELNARVRALLRRSGSRRACYTAVLRLDIDRRGVFVNDHFVELTPTEYILLEHLCQHPDELHTASRLLQALWEYQPGAGDTALVRNHIHNLRRKIEENPDRPSIIVSLHGRGYTVKAGIVSSRTP